MTNEKMGVSKRPLWLTVIFSALIAVGAFTLWIPLPVTGSVLMMGAVGVFAVLSMTSKPRLFLPLGAVALAAVFLIGQCSLFFAFLGVLILIMSAVLAVAIKNKNTKSGTAVALSVALLIGAVLIAAVLYVMAGNAFTPKAIGESIDKLFAVPKDFMAELTDRYFAELTEAEKELLTQNGVELDKMREMLLMTWDATVETVRALTPGLIIAAAEILSYIAVCVFVLTAKCTRMYALLPEPKWVLCPTQITCIVFFATLLIYVIASFFPAVGVVTVAMANLLLILLPSMTACGVRGIVVRLRHPLLRRRTLILLIIFSALTLFTFGIFLPAAVMLVAFIGARDVSSLRAAESIFQNKNKKD